MRRIKEAAKETRCAGRWMAVISDFVEGPPDRLAGAAPRRFSALRPENGPLLPADVEAARGRLRVSGGYLERLPLASIKAGLVDHAEIWHHWRGEAPPPPRRDGEVLVRRSFRLDGDAAPFASLDMLDFIECHGSPAILVVLGLGVDATILDACRNSLIVYNSIDAPPLRVPPEVSRRFDLVIVAAHWQSAEVRARHPGMSCLVLPIGPEFAAPDLFRPLGLAKAFDVIYVAAAQPYKRHDILFDAVARRPGIRALCVFGYGELADGYRDHVARLGLAVDCVGPPGVSHEEVNRLMNLARIGVVCGVDDGAPAILTEYMLAGLPVLANERLCCGLQYISPETGTIAPAERFAEAIGDLLERADGMNPRDAVLSRWIWPHSVERFAAALDEARSAKVIRCGGAAATV